MVPPVILRGLRCWLECGTLRYGGSASTWGFGLYLASSGKYENQILPTGTPQEALDCACGLYLGH